VFCWATGALVDMEKGPYRVHELSLLRRLYHHFEPGDVVLADRAYGSYVDIARLLQHDVFCVFRLHQRRKSDFRKGKRLGHNDQLVQWYRPQQYLSSCGISRNEFEQLPESLLVRQIRITQVPKGFRSRTIVVVTTLLDPIETPADEIRALYRDRWTAELNLRSLKTMLGMDVLRGHSVDVVHKEIAMHVLAYNLIRLLMWHAARKHGVELHRLSFTGTLHRWRYVILLLMFQAKLPTQRQMNLLEQYLKWIAFDQLPYRPNRIEPRRRKRRSKEYSFLTKPRNYYRNRRDLKAR